MEAILTDWRKRWPAAFTKPVPLAAGFSGHIKAALRAEGSEPSLKAIGLTIHQWTHQGAYLYAVMRGEMRRRNLDGSEAGVPDDEARQQAKQLLAERAARRAEKERQRQAKQQAAAATSPAQADHAGSSWSTEPAAGRPTTLRPWNRRLGQALTRVPGEHGHTAWRRTPARWLAADHIDEVYPWTRGSTLATASRMIPMTRRSCCRRSSRIRTPSRRDGDPAVSRSWPAEVGASQATGHVAAGRRPARPPARNWPRPAEPVERCRAGVDGHPRALRRRPKLIES
jgi:sRNA-binding protein